MLRANVIVTAADEVAWWLAYSDSSEWPDGDEAKIRRYIDGLQRRSGFQGADVPRHVAYLADAIRRRKSGEVFDVEGPAGGGGPSFGFVDAAEFFASYDDAPIPELIPGLIPYEATTYIGGQPKARKTTVAMHLALCAASGSPFFGRFAVDQGPVLCVFEEDDPRRVGQRLLRLARGMSMTRETLAALPIRLAVQKFFRFDDTVCVDKVIADADAIGAKLIIVDSLARTHAADENSRTEMQAVTKAMSRITVATGAALVPIHHAAPPPISYAEIVEA